MAKPYDRSGIHPTGIERPWDEDEIIVSKTDLKGHVTYANDVFPRLSQMEEKELLGKPHNIIRHPDMPRCVFKLLWDHLKEGREIFAYVNNLAKSGDHYWVFAHVTPSRDADGAIVGYHSNRRKPQAEKIEKIRQLYAALLEEERRHDSPKEALQASCQLLATVFKDKGTTYDQFIFSL